MLGAGLLTAAILSLAVACPPRSWLPALDVGSRLAHASIWCMLPITCLAVMIGVVARARFLGAEDIDAGAGSESSKQVLAYQSILQNTLEQSFLATATYMVWALFMPTPMQLAPASAAVLFVVGRVLFFRAYGRGAPARALGFGLTFYPTVAMIVGIFAGMAVARF